MSHVYEISGYFLAASIVGFFAPFLISLLVQRENVKETGFILLVLAIIGACSGMAGGMSRVGAVGSIIPAFLGLLGGMSIYLFGLDRSKGLIASFGAASLSISLLVSYTLGSQYRNIGDDHRNIRDHCVKAYTNHDLLSDPNAFKIFRERLGTLCDSSMSWHIAK
ncbi:MAG: hypothetical protein V3T17_03515 [Pseudomonadales bacterium]